MDLIREIQQIIALNEQKIANREQAADLIRQEIEDCGTEIDRRELELEDVMFEVTSPETSDDEDLRQVRPHREQNHIVRMFKNAILTAEYQPAEVCNFFELYEDPQYRRRVIKKIKKIKKRVKSGDVEQVMNNPRYLEELRRIQTTYPSHGGREMLNELIAIYVTMTYN